MKTQFFANLLVKAMTEDIYHIKDRVKLNSLRESKVTQLAGHLAQCSASPRELKLGIRQ